MTLTIALSRELEERLRTDAEQERRSVEEVVSRRLEEAELLHRIFSYFPAEETREFRALARKRQGNALHDDDELIDAQKGYQSISISVTDGIYMDPVGFFQEQKRPILYYDDPGDAVSNWPSMSTLPIDDHQVFQSIGVHVAGHNLSPAIINREVDLIHPNKVDVIWP